MLRIFYFIFIGHEWTQMAIIREAEKIEEICHFHKKDRAERFLNFSHFRQFRSF
jgi:hypothetical protein